MSENENSESESPPPKQRLGHEPVDRLRLEWILSEHQLWLTGRGGKPADFTGENLSGAKLRGVDLTGATLESADLSKADLQGATLYKANVEGADLSRANLEDAKLRSARLRGANIQQARLARAVLLSAHLEEASLREADARDANFFCASLERADLTGTNLHRANLREANLQGANLQNANLRHVNLEKANLRNAVLTRVNLVGARLVDADLADARFRKTRGGVFDHVHTRGAQFGQITFFSASWLQLRKSYTGTRTLFHLVFLIAFLIPLSVRAMLLVSVNRGQTALVATAAELKNAAALLQAEEHPSAPAVDRVADRLGSVRKCLADDCREDLPVWKVLLALDEGPRAGIPTVLLLLYNLIRGWLTWKLGPLRDDEDATGYSPPLRSYRHLVWAHWAFTGLLFVAVTSAINAAFTYFLLPVSLPAE